MTSLKLRFLGAPRVTYQEQPIKFRSRKSLALLIYLVVTGQPHSREALMTLLWPHSDRERASLSLRNALTRLRQALQAGGDFLLIDGDQVGFDFDRPLDLDLRVVEKALQPRASLPRWQAAVEAAGGEFLAGFSVANALPFEEWVTVQREGWQRNLNTIYAQLTQAYLAVPQPQRAIETASHWLTRAPHSETAYRFLMEAQALAGDRSAALQSYEACRAMLAIELGVAPMAETVALAERIQSLRLPIDDLTPPDVNVTKGKAEAPSPKRPTLPLVGRTEEHRRLVTAFRLVLEGHPQTVSIIGEAGIGKTRLVEDFLTWLNLQTPGVDILSGRAFEMGGRLSYEPVVNALRLRLEQENAPDDLLSDVWLAELSQLLPELRDRYPDLPLPLTGDADFVRHRLFEAVAILGQALADRRLVVLMVDDVQWAGDGTLDLLHYLVRRWTEMRVRILLLLTIRQETLMAMPALAEWLTHLDQVTTLQRLNLSLLTETDLGQLVTMLAGNEVHNSADAPAAKFAAWLHTETEGSPFFVAAMLTMLAEQGLMVRHEQQPDRFDMGLTWQQIKAADDVPLPPTVRDIILQRLGRLSEQAGYLLLAGAVIGRQCRYERLCQIAGVDELAGLTPLEKLLESGLLLESTGQQPYSLSHDNVREIVYTQAGEARRRVYHRRTLDALEVDETPASELAFHALAAGLDEPAFRYALAAGDQASAIYAAEDALKHYAQALQIVPRLDVDSQTLSRLYTNRGHMFEVLSRFDEAMATYEALAALAEQRRDSRLEMTSLLARGALMVTLTPFLNQEKGRTLIEQGLKLARDLGDQHAEVKALRGMLQYYLTSFRDYDEAIVVGQTALSLACELNRTDQEAYISHDLLYLYLRSGALPQAQIFGGQAQTLWHQLGNLSMMASTLQKSSRVHYHLGEFDQSTTLSREALELARISKNIWWEPAIIAEAAHYYWALGEYDAALQHLKEATEIIKKNGLPDIQISYLTYWQLQFVVDLGLVEPGWALADSLTAKPLDHPFLPFPIEDMLTVFRANLHLLDGDPAAAKQLYQTIPDELRQFRTVDLSYYETPLFLAHLTLGLGDYDQTIFLADKLMALHETGGVRSTLADAYFIKGQALLATGEIDTARQTLIQAKVEAKALKARRIAWKILAALADLEAQQGNEPIADDHRHEARLTLESIINHIPEGELRASFMALPEVRRFLDKTE
jgi:DNA-binding SARP family transcriptional activator